MSQSSKSLALRITTLLRRFFGRYFRELTRTGKVLRTLWDASHLQAQQRRHYQHLGEVALKLYQEGKIHHEEFSRVLIKMEQNEHVLGRLELLLKSYQQRTDIRDFLREHRIQNKERIERLEPV